MTVIEVIKSYSTGKITKYIILSEEESLDVSTWAEEKASRWAEEDGCGHGNGYSYKWETVTDTTIILKALGAEYNRIEEKELEMNKRKKEILKMISETWI